MAKELKLEPGRFDLLDYPEPLGVGESSPNSGCIRLFPMRPRARTTDPLTARGDPRAVGPDHWPAVRDHLTARNSATSRSSSPPRASSS